MLSASGILLAAVLSAIAGCGGSASPPTVPTGPITVAGDEHLAWDQTSADGAVLSYGYVAYVDGVRQPLADASCEGSDAGTRAQCLAQLPRMTAATHTLQLAAVASVFGVEREGPRSAPLLLVVTGTPAGASAPAATSIGARSSHSTNDGTPYVVETIAAGLDRPSAIVPLPDRSILVADASGIVHVWEGDALLADPAFELGDAAATRDVGLVAMTRHPHFEENHQLFLAYTALRHDGAPVNRVVRLREVGHRLGEAAVLLDEAVTSVPLRTPRIRFGPDGKLYVAFAAGVDPSESMDPSSYAGKILRLNDDGTTPSDNPRLSPIISTNHRAPGAFAWQIGTGRLWVGERLWDGRDVLHAGASPSPGDYAFDSVLDPSAAIFYSGKAIARFQGDLLIGALDGQHIRRVRFDEQDSGRVVATERLVDGDFGRIGDVAEGADGAIYFSTSNPRGPSFPGGDRLLRMVPQATAVPRPGR